MADMKIIPPAAGGHAAHTAPAPSAGAVAPGGLPSAPTGRGGSLVGHGTGAHNLQELALGLRAYRQQLIASNIANADTPGYKAVDIDFQEALRIALAARAQEPVKLATPAPGHLGGSASANPFAAIPLQYRVPAQESVDGNTVEIDVERAKFAENAFLYEFTLDRVSMQYKHMIELFESLKD